MAILTTLDTPSGVAATYWAATEATMNLRARVVNVTLRGWVDEVAFATGRQPLDQRRLTFHAEQLDLLPGGAEMQITSMVEGLAMMTPEFAPSEPGEG